MKFVDSEYHKLSIDRQVRAVYDMICLLEDENCDYKEIFEIECAMKGWILLALRAAQINDDVSKSILTEILGWAFYVLSREEAADYYIAAQKKENF